MNFQRKLLLRVSLFSPRILQVLFLFLFSTTLFERDSKAHAEDKPSLRMGAILSLSGGLEQYGNELLKGYELAVADTSPVKIELLIEDDHSINRTATVAAAKKLIEVDKVHLLFNWTTSSTPPLIPIAQQSKIALIAGGYDDAIANGGEYIFGCEVNYLLLPGQAANLMTSKLGKKRIAIITVADYWSQSYPARFKQRAIENGATIVLEESVDPTTKDLKSLILRAQQSRADGIFAPIYGNSLMALVHQANALKFQGIIHGADGIFDEDVRTLGQDAEGVYGAQVWVDDPGFAARAQKGSENSSSALQLGLVASGYDAVRHVREIAEKIVAEGRSITRDSILAGVKTHRSHGVLGPMFLPEAPVYSGERDVVVRGGKFVLVDP